MNRPSSSQSALHAIANAARLDLQRLTSAGIVGFLALLAFIPVATLLMPLIIGDDVSSLSGLSGVVNGMGIGVFAMTSLNIFFYEQQGQHDWMSGIVPISRTHQVLGRYCYLMVIAVLMSVELLVSSLILRLMYGGFLPGGMGVKSTNIVALVTVLLLASILYPLLYRFAYQRAITVSFVVAFGLFAAAFLLARFMPDALEALLNAVQWLVGHTAWFALVGISLVVVMLAVSILCSLRIYRAKEL